MWWRDVFMYVLKHDAVLAQVVAIIGILVAQFVTVGKILIDRKDRLEKEEKDALHEELTNKAMSDGINVHMMNEAILDAANVAIILIDSDFNIFRWNDAACAMFGWTEREMRKKPIETILPHGFNARYMMTLNKTVGIQAVTKNGDTIDICLSPSEGEFADHNRFFCAVISPLATLTDLGRGQILQMHRLQGPEKGNTHVEIAYSTDEGADEESDIVRVERGF